MGKTTLAKQRAQGLIGQGRVDKLYTEGQLVIIFAAELERLTQRIATLERENKLLREIAADSTRANVVAAQVLREAIER